MHVLKVDTVSVCSYARSNGRLLLRLSHSPVYVVMKDGFVHLGSWPDPQKYRLLPLFSAMYVVLEKFVPPRATERFKQRVL